MIKLMPLLNMLALCGEDPPGVISIFVCSDCMSEGGEGCTVHQTVLQGKSCSVWSIFYMYWFIDALFFDGASNVHKVGECSVQYVLWNFVSMAASMCCLYFSAVLLISGQSKWVCVRFFFVHVCAVLILSLQSQILKTCKLHNVFGSGASHGIHEQFVTQAWSLNSRKEY